MKESCWRGGAGPEILLKLALGALLALAVLCAAAAAAFGETDIGELDELLEQSGVNEAAERLSPATRELMRELGIEEISPGALMALSPKSFLRLTARLAADRLLRPLKNSAAICAAALLCAAAENMKLRADEKTVGGVVSVVGSLCCCAAVAVPAGDIIERVGEAVGECADFLLSFVPVYAGIAASGGKPAAAAAYNAALFGVAQASGRLASDVIEPLAGIFLALALVGAAAPSFGLTELAGSIKKTVNWALGLISTVFVGALGLQSAVGASSDGVTMKAARFAVSSTVPVVGGALAEAMSSAAGYLGLLKNVTGAFGIAAGAAIFLPIVVELALWRFGLGIAAVFAETAGASGISRASRAAGDVLEMLLALTLSLLLIMIVATGILLAAGTA